MLIFRWMSSVDGRPGFSNDAVDFLKNKINGEESWRFRRCVLIIDGRHIKNIWNTTRRFNASEGSLITVTD